MDSSTVNASVQEMLQRCIVVPSNEMIQSSSAMSIHTSMISDDMSEPSSPESNGPFDETDLLTQAVHDEVTTQLAAAGPVGVAAAAAIVSGKKHKRPHAFETNPSLRKRQQTRLLRTLNLPRESHRTNRVQQWRPEPWPAMPASRDDQDPLEASLKASLGIEDNLENRIAASSLKKVLFQNIEFEEAKKTAVQQLGKLKSKYVFLKGTRPPEKSEEGVFQKPYDVKDGNMLKSPSTSSGPMVNGTNGSTSLVKEDESSWNKDENFPKPKVTLYRGEIELYWKKWSKIGAGLHNMGNTCFLNSVLQCLTYTAPLTNYLMSNAHAQNCRMSNFCMMCELQRHVRRCFENSGQAIRPQPIISRLRSIAKHMQWGRQEDAHEFLRYVVEAMLRSCQDGVPAKLDPTSKATTVVNKIFSGYLRSQVRCASCHARSNTYDPFLDISLDIKNVPSIERAFQKFVEPERLDGDNLYDCPRCKRSCPATKLFTLHKPSNVLTIQLKRFDYNRMFGGKIMRHIEFKSELDVRPFMSVKGEPVRYRLYGVLVHSGLGCNSGHYYCYVRAPDNNWYCMNDAHVYRVGWEKVSQQEAYLLFYMRIGVKNQTTPKFQTPAQGQSKLVHLGKNGTVQIQRPLSIPTNDLGTPVAKPLQPKMLSPLPNQRDKISFGIRPKQTEEPVSKPPVTTVPTMKPRIVMNIKRSGDGSYQNVEKLPLIKKKTSLVPYNGEDSDSPSEKDSIITESTALNTNNSAAKPDSSQSTKPLQSELVPKLSGLPKTNGSKTEPDVVKPKVVLPTTPMSAPEPKPRIRRTSFNGVDRLDGGQLSLNTNAPRVNATSPWSVLYKDCAISPSVGSESSTTSVNSTTEWKIHEKNTPSTPLVPDCQHSGWTVSPKAAVKPILLKKCTEETKDDSEDSDDLRKPLLFDEKEERKKKKKKRKHSSERSSDHDEETKYRRLSDSSPDLHKKKKKKKHERKERERKPSLSQSESDYEWVERTKETITIPAMEKSETKRDHSEPREPSKSTRNKYESQNKPTDSGEASNSWKSSSMGPKLEDDFRANSDVVSELESRSSGYGGSVLSWSGEASSLDREVHKEKRRSSMDEYEEELDRGKAKKYRENKHRSFSHSARNMFQKAQDMKNKHHGYHKYHHSSHY